MSSQLPAPWMLGSTEFNDIPMLIVHMSNGELEGLDNLQGGPSVDESTGIREYSKLSEIIEMPEVKELFYKIAADLKKNKGKLSPEISEAYKVARQHSLPYRETDEEEHNPLRALEHKGTDGDTKLAELPYNFVDFLMSMGFSVNPKTGLLQFAFWDEIARISGTIGGFWLGGPAGAGAGRALAGMLTGQKPGHAAAAGVKTGAGAYALQGLGQAAGLGAGTPGVGGIFAGPPNALATGLGGLMGQSGGINPAIQAAATTAPQQMVAAAQPGFMDHILGAAGKLAPYAPLAMAGLSYMGAKKHHKHEKSERERQEEKWHEERKRKEWMYEPNWDPIDTKKYEVNPEFYNRTPEEVKHGIMVGPTYREIGTSGRYATGGLVQSYSKGTLVRGRGKGQDDFIKTSVPESSYIWDASVTSDIGDGSSSAGAKIIKKFEDRVKKLVPKNILKSVEKSVRKNCKQAPVFLSNDEYKSDPVAVSVMPFVMGKKEISNEKGANILRGIIKNIRKHKISEGDGLPPKAKPLLEYISAR